MHLSKHDLQQMDDNWLQSLPSPVLLEVSKRLLSDVKSLQDRLNQNPSNSSRPPSSQAPWDKASSSKQKETTSAETPISPLAPALEDAEDVEEDPPASDDATPAPEPTSASPSDTPAPTVPSETPRRRPGGQPGHPGHGRTQKLVVTDTQLHRPPHCTACGTALPEHHDGQSYTAWDEIELVPLTGATLGLTLSVTRHHLLEVRCACGHISRALPWRATEDALWENVTPGQWRLVGAQLAGFIVMLAFRMRLSRRRIQELLESLFGLELSVGLIDQTIRETARLSEPLEEVLVAELHEATQLHVDETSWPESKVMQWLWVLVSAQTVLYLIGPRSRATLDSLLDAAFAGTLMSDGYGVYRNRTNRLRCWAHLMRKVRGLVQSADQRAAAVGLEMEVVFKRLQTAIYAARAAHADPPSLMQRHAEDIEALRQVCEANRDHAHEKVSALAREFLNDWAVIMRPMGEPNLPLTNNAAEQALRHWVIARQISHGTRTRVGSRAFGLLASVIGTCRLRGACVWRYLGRVIAAGRQGLELPALPAVRLVGV
jgi:transposase